MCALNVCCKNKYIFSVYLFKYFTKLAITTVNQQIGVSLL